MFDIVSEQENRSSAHKNPENITLNANTNTRTKQWRNVSAYLPTDFPLVFSHPRNGVLLCLSTWSPFYPPVGRLLLHQRPVPRWRLLPCPSSLHSLHLDKAPAVENILRDARAKQERKVSVKASWWHINTLSLQMWCLKTSANPGQHCSFCVGSPSLEG